MEKNKNETIGDASSLNMGTTTTTTTTRRRSQKKSGGGIGSLIKLLPTGTVFLFQFLNPILTNSGDCKTSNKYLTSILLIVCAFNCIFTTFTDSYTGSDNKRHYGIVTTKGLWSPVSKSNIDLSKYKLKGSDFVHAALTLLVFALLGLLDINTVHCLYPSFESTQKHLLLVLPPVLGVVVGCMFFVYPNHRHGIGYPVSTDSTTDTSRISNHTTTTDTDAVLPPQNTIDNV